MTNQEIWNRFAIAQRELTELIKLDKLRAKNFKSLLKTSTDKQTKGAKHGTKTRKEIRSKT